MSVRPLGSIACFSEISKNANTPMLLIVTHVYTPYRVTHCVLAVLFTTLPLLTVLSLFAIYFYVLYASQPLLVFCLGISVCILTASCVNTPQPNTFLVCVFVYSPSSPAHFSCCSLSVCVLWLCVSVFVLFFPCRVLLLQCYTAKSYVHSKAPAFILSHHMHSSSYSITDVGHYYQQQQ